MTVLFTAVHIFDSYVHEDERGVHPEVEFIYDLKLPEDFEPINADGEVQEFKLYPVTQVKNETFYTKKIIIIFILFQNDNKEIFLNLKTCLKVHELK